MKLKLPRNLLTSFAKFLQDELGLYYPPERFDDLITHLSKAAHLRTQSELTSFMKQMITSPSFRQENLDQLSEILTIGETYFFRIGCGFDAIRESILPHFFQEKQKTKKLRIWSAACCTGEEVYSIAILIDELFPLKNEWSLHLLGTDLNKKFLNIARLGLYRHWSFRATPKQYLKKYFIKKEKNLFELLPQIRSMVHFEHLNLIEDNYPSKLDLILCNNSLIYFGETHIQQVLTKLVDSLAPGGKLIVSSVEAALVSDPRLARDDINIFTKKERPIVEVKPLAALMVEPLAKIAKPLSISIEQAYNNEEYQSVIDHLKGVKMNDQQLLYLIRSHLKLGNLDEAEALCNNGELNPEVHYHFATIYLARNLFDEATLELKRALFIDSNYIMAHYLLSCLKHAQGKDREAKRHQREALKGLEKMNDLAIVPRSENLSVKYLRGKVENYDNSP